MAQRQNKKVANGLVALSSAAILAVYAAGFMKTKAAAERMEEASNARRPMMPAPATAGETRTPARIEPPAETAKATEVKSPVMPKPEATAGTPAAKTSTKSAASAKAPGAPVETPTLAETSAAIAAAGTLPDVAASAAPAKPDEKLSADLLMPKEHYKDGVYLGWGHCRHGDIQASIMVENGRITAAAIAQCWTRYSCGWVAHLPPQVVARQSPDVDWVSGATESANAFYWAIIDALAKAK